MKTATIVLAVILTAAALRAAPTPESLLHGTTPSASMQQSYITQPEAHPEKIERMYHSLNRQKADLLAMAGKCDLLMVGDSLTAGFLRATNAWLSLTNGLTAYNAGVGGETVQGMIYRVREWPVELQPRMVTVLCGANNPSYEPWEIAAGTIVLVQEIRTKWPAAKVIFVSLTPRGTGPEDALCAKVKAVNELTSQLADGAHIQYLDLWKVFTYQEDQQGYRGIKFEPKDKLHFTAEGYELWAEALRPLLRPAGQ